jgi:hypothetical protein
LFLNQFSRESRNKIIWKLCEEETIFISAFNAENLMKIKLHEDIKINSNNSTIKGENFMKIG